MGLDLRRIFQKVISQRNLNNVKCNLDEVISSSLEYVSDRWKKLSSVKANKNLRGGRVLKNVRLGAM